MTTLSARYVRHPRHRYVCDWCSRAISGPYIRLYGRGMDGDPMSTLRLHPAPPCISADSCDVKVQAALQKARSE